MKKILLWGALGCMIFVFGFLAGSFWSTLKFFGSLPKEALDIRPGGTSIGSIDRRSNFYGNIFWGGSFKPMEELEPLPQGDATLKVRFNYDQIPVAGVGFSLALNGKYRTAMLTTDPGGEVDVSLPFGRWELNRLECRNWTAQPQGDFLLVSGDEEKLGASLLNELFFPFGNEGKIVLLSKDNNPIQTLPIEIKNRIKVVWPPSDERKQNATIANSVIEWEPYLQATSYVVQINHVTRESVRSTKFSPIIHKKVDGASSIALSQLPNVKSDAAPNEYAIEIRAYAQDGSFLSESGHGLSTFTITDDHILVEYNESEGMTLDQNGVERKFQAQQAMEAVILLINKKMFQEAHKLLVQTDASELPGQVAMLNGYLYAAQGRCEEARKYFQEALSRGQKCIPEKYREGCNAE